MHILTFDGTTDDVNVTISMLIRHTQVSQSDGEGPNKRIAIVIVVVIVVVTGKRRKKIFIIFEASNCFRGATN